MPRKLALIIGNSEYQDASLAKLITPNEDVNDLAEVLRAPDIGGFDYITTLINESDDHIRLGIEDFFADKNPDDLLILYFSGHGVRDEQGRLYLAVQNTRANRLRATAIPAEFVTSEMDRSRSKRQVLILDCCHSGAFAQGSKAVTGESAGTGPAFEGSGYGRVVLTATDATQYAWEGDKVIGQAENSVFTHFLIDGLRTGAADINGDGKITLDEMYDYVYEQVVNMHAKQTPGKWSYKQQGDIVIAQNPHPATKSVALSIELQQSIDDSRPWVRESAVRELDRLLASNQPGLALAAQAGLKHLAEDDSRKVAAAAVESLNAYEARLRIEAERLVQEKAEQERVAQEKVEQQQIARQKAGQERLAKEQAEQARLAENAQRAEQEQQAGQTVGQRAAAPVRLARWRKMPRWIWIGGSVLILVALVALVVIPAAQQPANLNALERVRSQWHIVFGDSFDVTTNQWEIGAYNDPSVTVDRQIVDGKYRWDMTAGQDFATVGSSWGNTDADFYLSADVQQISGLATCCYGLTFRGSTQGTYEFRFDHNDQYFGVESFDEGSGATRDLIAWTESTAIRPGETNTLSVIAEGSHYRFFINDQPVGDVTDEQWDSGSVSLFAQLPKAGDTTVLEFDNVELRAP